MRLGGAGAILVAALTVAACGTTVSQTSQARGGEAAAGTGQLGGAPGASAGPGVPAGAGGNVSNPSSLNGSAGALAAGPGGAASPAAGGATDARVSAATAAGGIPSGVSARVPAAGPVQIGFLVTKCSNCDLLGASYVAPAHSEQDILQALINDVNQRGGVLGHKIVPVWAAEDTASTDWSTMMQSICSTFTQDNHVAAVVGAGFGYEDILSNCLAKAGVVAFDAMRTTGVPDDSALSTHPGYIVTGEPSANAYELVAVTSAISDGWLTHQSKLGVMNYDCPTNAAAWKDTVGPYLASHGYTVAENYVASCPTGAADVGSAAQEVQSAELKMRAMGVDTVLITDIPLVVFAEDAESQHWYPKYLATEGGAMYESYVPADQLRNIHSAGWEPMYDLDTAHLPPLDQTQRNCLAALTRGGLTGETSSEYYTYFGLCGGFDLYLQAVAKAQSLSTSQVIKATDAMSNSFLSPMLLGGQTLLDSTKHAAAVEYRSEVYDQACSCFQYQGPVRPLPTTN
jgi:hypothetical protein